MMSNRVIRDQSYSSNILRMVTDMRSVRRDGKRLNNSTVASIGVGTLIASIVRQVMVEEISPIERALQACCIYT
jgi:hypothetical protein